MSMAILDHRGAVLKTIHIDAHDEDRVVEVTTEDLDPLLEAVKRAQEYHKQGSDMKLAAYMPVHVAEKMMREGSWNDRAAIGRWCNDPANKPFRIWQGRI